MTRVLHARFLEVLDDHRLELADRRLAPWPSASDFGPFFVGRQHAMRREAFDGERPGDADALVVFVGLIVEQLGVGVTRDGGVNFLLPLAAQLPPFGVEICILPCSATLPVFRTRAESAILPTTASERAID